MMVTITSMKKIQSPDLLLDPPHLNNHHHRFTNNLNKKSSRCSPKSCPKTRRLPAFNSPELSASSISSTTTTLTSTAGSNSQFETRKNDRHNNDEVAVDVDCLDENSRWPQQNSIHRPPPPPHHPHVNPLPTPRLWIRAKTKASSSSSVSTTSSSSRDDWISRLLPNCLHFWRAKSCTNMNKRHLIVLLVVSLILVTCLVTLLALLLRSNSHIMTSSLSSTSGDDNKNKESNLFISTDINQIEETPENPAEVEEEESEQDVDNYDYGSQSSSEHNSKNNKNNLDLKEVSRLSWNMLNNNQERVSSNAGSSGSSSSSGNSRNQHHSPRRNLIPSSFSSISGDQELILPSKMIFTSSSAVEDPLVGKGGNSGPNSSGETTNKNKKRSCCRTQKYSQVIKRDGCEPLTIPNRMCFGQCVSVWVPGLFASFPVCRPSRSSWKTVTLTCAKNRKRRVRIEKVRRCSCMEIEPTAPSPISTR